MSQSNQRKLWPNKLLVEGKDDLHVIANLREKHSLPETVEIVNCESIDNVAEKFLNYFKLKRPNIEVIGVVVDADSSITSRWESYKTLLRTNGYSVPDKPVPTGTIIKGERRNPDVGIWIMPDNQQQTGMLEDFFLNMVSNEDKLLPIVLQAIDDIEKQGLNLYRAVHQAKAKAHTWLAWQESPGTTLGLAIKKSYLNHQAELGTAFIRWYRDLFRIQ